MFGNQVLNEKPPFLSWSTRLP